MKKRFSETQIVYELKQAEAGTPIREVTRKMNISEQTDQPPVWKPMYMLVFP